MFIVYETKTKKNLYSSQDFYINVYLFNAFIAALSPGCADPFGGKIGNYHLLELNDCKDIDRYFSWVLSS